MKREFTMDLEKADPSVEIKFGPNIKDWPTMVPLTDNLLLKSSICYS